MSNIDLSDANVAKLCDSFSELLKKPAFSISTDTDVHILFFKRRDKYYGVRTGLKSDFESREQFLIYSLLIEEIDARIKTPVTLRKLSMEDCSSLELKAIYSRAVRIENYLPKLEDIDRSYTIVNDSELNWNFLEGERNYHSVFWNESESKLFSRCA